MAGRGFNSFSGFDTGPPPPRTGSGFAPFQSFGYGFQQPMCFQQPMGFQQPSPFFYPGGTHASAPPSNGGYPGINLPNSTGGMGVEPGYNYLFHPDNCKVHVFKTDKAPWHMDPYAAVVDPFNAMLYAKFIVPVNMTMQTFMKAIGCSNADPKENVIHEISEVGNGKWIKGLTFKGDDKDRMKKEVKDFGWTKARSGEAGGVPVVWVWMCPSKG